MTKSIRVIKIGGRVQADPSLAAELADAWQAASSSLCVVHGGGDEISTLQRAMGVEPVFVGGRRATTEQDVDLVRMALSGSANKRLVAALISAGVDAVGVSGEDAALIGARIAHGGALGRVGEPSRINVRLLGHLLDGAFLPVISPVGRQVERDDTTLDTESAALNRQVERNGTTPHVTESTALNRQVERNGTTPHVTESTALNVNGDDAAAAIAIALSASELLFVADVPGVLDEGVVIPTLDVDAAAELVSRGTAAGGMAAKLDAATRALAGGVGKVRIGDLAAIRDLNAGTTIVRVSHHVSTEPAGTAAAAGGRASTGH